MLAILNSLNAHNLPIFQPTLMILESKFMVHRAISDKIHLSLGLLSPLNIQNGGKMLAILNSLNAPNLPIFQPILTILVSNSWFIEPFLIKHTCH